MSQLHAQRHAVLMIEPGEAPKAGDLLVVPDAQATGADATVASSIAPPIPPKANRAWWA
jgi:hypothetical protein